MILKNPQEEEEKPPMEKEKRAIIKSTKSLMLAAAISLQRNQQLDSFLLLWCLKIKRVLVEQVVVFMLGQVLQSVIHLYHHIHPKNGARATFSIVMV